MTTVVRNYKHYETLTDQELISKERELKKLWEKGVRHKAPMNYAMAVAFRRGVEKSKQLEKDQAVSYLVRDSADSIWLFQHKSIEELTELLEQFKGERHLYDDLGFRVGEVKYTAYGCEITILSTSNPIRISYEELAKRCVAKLKR